MLGLGENSTLLTMSPFGGLNYTTPSWDSLSSSLSSENISSQILSALEALLGNISNSQYLSSPNGSIIIMVPETVTAPISVPPDIHFQSNHKLFPVGSLLKEDDLFFLSAIHLQYLDYIPLLLTLLLGSWLANRASFKSVILTDVLETVLSFLILLPTLPFLGFFFLSILLVRGFISLFYLRGSNLSLLNPVDGFWAFDTFASTSTCNGLYIIQGLCDVGKIRSRMRTTIQSDLIGGKMNRKLTSVLGFSAWETLPLEEMDMTKYVKVIKEGQICSETDVFEALKDTQDIPMMEKEPQLAPWEVIVLPKFACGKGKQPHYAVIYRVHHAIMDGISTANVLHSVMADGPFKFSLDPVEKKQSAWQSALLFTLGFISLPRVCLRNLLLMDNKFGVPEPQCKGPKTFGWSRPIRMEALKGIKKASESSVYAVLLSSLGGAFRRLDAGSKVKKYHVMCPIALLPYPDRKPRNRFTGVLVPSVVEGGLSPKERLARNWKELKDLGSNSATFLAVANWYFPVILGLLPLWMHRPLCSLIHLKMSVSNVPGPEEDVWIYDGGRIVDIGIWLPIKYSMGFGMGMFSYKDRVRATVIADSAYYPKESDVSSLTHAFETELTLLAESLGITDVFVKEDDDE